LFTQNVVTSPSQRPPRVVRLRNRGHESAGRAEEEEGVGQRMIMRQDKVTEIELNAP